MIFFSLMVLMVVYVFQHVNWYSLTGFPHDNNHLVFVFNKTTRFLLNDLACIVLIKGLFDERKYMVVAWKLFFIELLIVLPIYFIVKLSLEGDRELSSPLLSQIHRLIVNPVLMIILIAGFYYQQQQRTDHHEH